MGKEYFKQCCETFGIDFDATFCFGTAGVDRKANRLKCNSFYMRRNDTARFVIGYFHANDLYVVWDLHAAKAKKKSVFSVNQTKALEVRENSVLPITKAVEYSSWNEETVYVFTRETAQNFVCEYIVPILQGGK